LTDVNFVVITILNNICCVFCKFLGRRGSVVRTIVCHSGNLGLIFTNSLVTSRKASSHNCSSFSK